MVGNDAPCLPNYTPIRTVWANNQYNPLIHIIKYHTFDHGLSEIGIQFVMIARRLRNQFRYTHMVCSDC